MPLHLRRGEPRDIERLVDFNLAMALETEAKALDRARLTAGIARVIAEPARGFYLVAERDGEVVGCLMITHEWSDWRNGDWWWLQSVYVLPSARRGGVFRALYAEVRAAARATTDVIGLRLYVERANARALATYAALGMVDAGYALWEDEFAASH